MWILFFFFFFELIIAIRFLFYLGCWRGIERRKFDIVLLYLCYQENKNIQLYVDVFSIFLKNFFLDLKLF